MNCTNEVLKKASGITSEGPRFLVCNYSLSATIDVIRN